MQIKFAQASFCLNNWSYVCSLWKGDLHFSIFQKHMALFGLLNYISMALRGHKTTINTAENICSPVDVHFYAAVFQSKDSIGTVLSGGIQNNLVKQ